MHTLTIIMLGLNNSYNIGVPTHIPKLHVLLPCVYDTMIIQFYIFFISYYIHILISATCAGTRLYR